MKRVILLSGILIMFFSADILAQRGRQDNRGRRDRKEDVRRNDRGRDDRDGRKDRYGRTVKVVDRRVYRDNGRDFRNRNNGRRFNDRGYYTRNSRVYYDYDFKRGRRVKVNRGYRPSNRHIWVSGYWHYDRRLRRDIWIDGHWSLRLSQHRWMPGHYRVFNGVRVWIEGCWTVG
ncbi:hypothetical protein [Roseivirga sp.]|uniref:hypothetical protein n=1 Tax=Roseivirga sp. TaxID=1964215 RepID=UPI003B52E974